MSQVSPTGSKLQQGNAANEVRSAASSSATTDLGAGYKAVDHMKGKYQGGSETKPEGFPGKLMREPQKLDLQWDKVVESKDRKGAQNFMPKEQDMVTVGHPGVDYSKMMFQKQSSLSKEPMSPGKSPPTAVPVNRIVVEKVQAPETARNMRKLFESGQIPDVHEVKKMQVNLEESAESGVFENQPTSRDGVVREEDYVTEGEVVNKGATKSLLSQWKLKGTEEFKIERKAIRIAEDDGKILENEPIQRTDVVRSEEGEFLQGMPTKGHAQQLRQQWLTRKNEYQKENKPVRLVEREDEPSVLENQPTRREGVVREEDTSDEVLLKKGFTKDLRQQWQTRKNEYQKENKPVRLVEREDEPSVLENQPTRREGVVREEDMTDEVLLKKGFTKDLKGFWSAPKSDIVIKRGPIEIPRDEGTSVLENEPERLEGVIRADECSDDVIPIQRGHARNIADKWRNMKDESQVGRAFKLDIDTSQKSVFENEPEPLQQEVVKNTDAADEILGEKGRIRKIGERFLRASEEPRTPREQIIIERGSGEEVLENEPEAVAPGVIRPTGYQPDHAAIESGKTKNMVKRWLSQDVDSVYKKDTPRSPVVLYDKDQTVESGVFENAPQLRQDVIRGEEYAPEAIPVEQTRSTRMLWTKRITEEPKREARPVQMVRFTPPREMTPPRVHQEEFKSYQTITFASNSAQPNQEQNSPAANVTSNTNNSWQNEQHFYGSQTNDGYPEHGNDGNMGTSDWNNAAYHSEQTGFQSGNISAVSGDRFSAPLNVNVDSGSYGSSSHHQPSPGRIQIQASKTSPMSPSKNHSGYGQQYAGYNTSLNEQYSPNKNTVQIASSTNQFSQPQHSHQYNQQYSPQYNTQYSPQYNTQYSPQYGSAGYDTDYTAQQFAQQVSPSWQGDSMDRGVYQQQQPSYYEDLQSLSPEGFSMTNHNQTEMQNRNFQMSPGSAGIQGQSNETPLRSNATLVLRSS